MKLRHATIYGTKDELLQNVTKDAIEKAGKTGDVEAKCQAVDNAAALGVVEEQRRDATAAGEHLSTADAEAAFLVAQEGRKNAQQVQERHNAAEGSDKAPPREHRHVRSGCSAATGRIGEKGTRRCRGKEGGRAS